MRYLKKELLPSGLPKPSGRCFVVHISIIKNIGTRETGQRRKLSHTYQNTLEPLNKIIKSRFIKSDETKRSNYVPFETDCKTLKQITTSNKNLLNNKNKIESQLMRFQNSPPTFMNSFSKKVLLQFLLHVSICDYQRFAIARYNSFLYRYTTSIRVFMDSYVRFFQGFC